MLTPIVLAALVKPLSQYMAKVYLSEHTFLSPVLGPIERGIYRLSGIDANAESSWKGYAAAILRVNFIGFLVVYLLPWFRAPASQRWSLL